MSHARLIPSSAHRWVKCPGSVREEAKYPDTSGEAAIDGTHSHTLLEVCLINNQSADEYVNMVMNDHEGSFVVDQERADRVNIALGYIRARELEIGKPVTIRAESKVNPGALLGRDDCKGTADCVIVSNDVIEIIDYKDGMVMVEAKDNWQMILYTIGVLAQYPDAKFNKIRMTIIQPKLTARGLKAVNYVEMTQDEMTLLIAQLTAYAAATDSPDAPLVAGESQCKWCKAKANCPVLSEKALGDAQIMFKDVGIAEQSAKQDPAVMSDDKLVEVMEAMPLIREYLKAVEDEAFKRLNSGQSIKGLKLVNGRGTRKWAYDDDEMAEKLKKMGVPKGVIYPSKLISVAQIEKAKWSKKIKGDEVTTQLSERQLRNIKENYVSTLAGKLQVALESDSRSAVVKDAAEMFKDVQPVETEVTVHDIPEWMR